jgi:hypothetical protein
MLGSVAGKPFRPNVNIPPCAAYTALRSIEDNKLIAPTLLLRENEELDLSTAPGA